MRSQPELEVLRSVVVPNAVAVVDVLVAHEVASELLLHHEDVLKHLGMSGTGARMFRGVAHDVARLVTGAPSPPVPVGGAGDRLARLART